MTNRNPQPESETLTAIPGAYTLELTAAEAIVLAGIVERAEPFSPARRSLTAKAHALRLAIFDERDPAGRAYRHRARLEYLRGELRAERMSYAELAELESLAEFIEPGDVELLEAAGVPEFDA